MTPRKALIVTIMLSLIMLTLTACQTLPLNGRLPDNLAAEKITAVDADSPFAISPDGTVVALVHSGLQLFHIPSKEHVPLSKKTPRKLAWSPLGTSLAALFNEELKSRIVVYDQFGASFAETLIDAPLTDLGWLSDRELALGGTVITAYKFGSNYLSMLYRWQPGNDLPVASELRDSTLQPITVSTWLPFLQRGPLMDFSGQTPLISYLHPVDPPLFTPYYKLIIKDLASGRELEVGPVGLNADGARLSPDGEMILFGDGKGTTALRNPWSEELLVNVTSPGSRPALAPDGNSWFTDGTLFRKGAQPILLAPGAAAQFSGDGSRLLLHTGSDLYLLSGLNAAVGSMFVPALNEKIQKLRSLRAGGLISAQEYREALAKVVRP